jgi:hypothetical protein
MKFKNLFFFTCATFLTFSACTNDEQPDTGGSKQNYVKFSGAIQQLETATPKASGATWGAGDAIGVFMKAAGSNISASTSQNVEYTTSGTGAFSAADKDIELPADGSNVDFIAYYPFKSAIADYTYPINVSDQSDLTKIDLLYSDNATNANNSNSNVALNFKHKLSQLVLDISAGDGISSLTGLNLSVNGFTTDGSFNLANAGITLGATKSILSPVVNVVPNSTTVNIILIPGNNLNSGKMTFTLNGKTYEWTPDDQILESGKKYTYPIKISTTGLTVLNPNGTIEDWTEGNTGGVSIVITPSEEDVFLSDKSTVSLAATSSSDVIRLTTQSTEAWTAISDQAWLTVNPASGTGDATITLTADKNTGAVRSATVTLTPTTSTLSPVTVTVTQANGASTPNTLVFAGSDFEDWSAFVGNLNNYGLLSHGAQSATGGRNGSSALHISGTPAKNDYLFNAQVSTSIPVSATKINLYLKGTATGKSLSFNVYSPDAAAADGYIFNLGDCKGDSNLVSSAQNSYVGSIDTGGQWVKVSLDITGYNLNTSGNIFALKIGKSATYDLYVDDITFE